MPYITRPNSWVSQDAVATTQLTYALQLNPAPLTVSIDGRDPLLGSLEFVMTNTTASAISVSEVRFTIQVGTDGSNLTTSTDNVGTGVSDWTNWDFSPPGNITSGPADFTLSPKTGSSVSVAAGASIIVEIINFPTVENPGNTTINVKETAGSIGFTSFLATTFPSGFYFNSLSATVANGSQLVPVAQVANGSTVTLIWNSSVTELISFTIYYSNAAQGQQTATPSDTGIWTSPPLSADTVFTILVTVSIDDGPPLTASLSTAVAVQNPALIATSFTAGTATVNGPLTVNGATQANDITATGLTVNGNTSAGNITASGTLTGANGNITGLLTSNTATVASSLRINGPGSGTAFSLGGAGVFNIDAPNITGGRFTVQNNGAVGINSPYPGASLDVNGNLAVSSGAIISGGATISGNTNLCPAADLSQGSVGIGGTCYSEAMLTVSSNQAAYYGIYVNTPGPFYPTWAACVIGPCINSTGSWSKISDLTLKDGVAPFQDSLPQLLQINPIRYRFKEGLGLGTDEYVGVAAQDLETIAPYMVGKVRIRPDGDEEYLTIDDSAMTYMLINAVKELHAEIESLKTELKTLKASSFLRL
ncbi:MAG: tail fiber domain-containing protein [Terracidiphilus sp.]